MKYFRSKFLGEYKNLVKKKIHIQKNWVKEKLWIKVLQLKQKLGSAKNEGQNIWVKEINYLSQCKNLDQEKIKNKKNWVKEFF